MLYPIPFRAIETLGAPGDEALTFFQDLEQRITARAAEPRSFQFLTQRVSVAVWWGKCSLLCQCGSSVG